jgi:hypothetical protein
MYDDDRLNGSAGGRPLHCRKTIPHGTSCGCRLLAEALHQDPKTISYEYCCNVLQRRWHMTCGHGESMPAAAPSTLELWKDVGEMTPLNALLIQNA